MERILIKNAFLVDMVKKEEKIIKKDVLIEDGKISKIEENIQEDVPKIINADGKVLMPGFINVHTHSPMAIFRGYADDNELMYWLENKIWPVEDKLTEEEIYESTRLSLIEMAKSGTTTFNDMYFMMNTVAKATEEVGLRAYLGRCIMNVENEEDIRIKEAIELYEKYQKHDLIHVTIAPHAPYTCNQLALQIARNLTKELNTMLHIHLDETKKEHDDFLKNYGMTPTAYLDKLHLFDVPTILAHGVWLDDEDRKLLKNKEVSIVHNPVSNAKLASGICPVTEYLKYGINVCLGTDGAGSTNLLDMFEEMKLCSYFQKVKNLDSASIDAYTILEMATKNGAKALGISDIVGTIEVGKEADFILVDMTRVGVNPINDIYSNLVYACNGSDVEYVFVKGNLIVENKKMTSVSETEIIKKCNEIANKYFQES